MLGMCLNRHLNRAGLIQNLSRTMPVGPFTGNPVALFCGQGMCRSALRVVLGNAPVSEVPHTNSMKDLLAKWGRLLHSLEMNAENMNTVKSEGKT